MHRFSPIQCPVAAGGVRLPEDFQVLLSLFDEDATTD
jgi:hypothetical protein